MATKSAPVQTEVFEIRDTPVKVEYSIEVFNGLVFDSETEVNIYSVNAVPASFFEEDILEAIDLQIKFHKAKIGKYSESQCGHDEWLSNQMD